MSHLRWLLVVAFALIASSLPIDADAGFVAKNFFGVYKNVSNEKAFDFFATVDGGIRSSNVLPGVNPVSNRFNQFEILDFLQAGDDRIVRFFDGTVDAGANHTIVYRAVYDDTKRTGKVVNSAFTRDNPAGQPIPNSSKMVALDASAIFTDPSSATVSIGNNSGFSLTGTVALYANPGFSSVFDTDQWDDLNPSATTILPSQSFSLADGDNLPTVTASLLPDEYLLVLGSVTNDSAGTFNFALAFAPVPEPTTFSLLGIGALGLLGFGWARRRPTGRGHGS